MVIIVFFLGLYVFHFVPSVIQSQLNPVVETQNGKIVGNFNKGYFSFLSIPYAEPPINENRFESPIPFTKNWTKVLNCTQLAEECVQWNNFKFSEDRVSGIENCLFLNIYTPKINDSELLPVLIFIHGGAFQYGNANIFGPDLLMENKNIIVVTIAYRLGPLGFLSTEDEEISGNMGIKDQKLALIWINKNIKNFGGNNKNISLTGFSAGGASVHIHILNKDIENLISSAISFSGTLFCPWVLVHNPLEQTQKLASILNCKYDNTKSIKRCLKKLPAENIVRAVGSFQFSQYFPFRIFGPVIESHLTKDAVLKIDPETLIKNTKIPSIPWIVSYTSNDGGYNAAEMLRTSENKDFFKDFLENFNVLAPKALFFGETLEKTQSNNYSILLKEKYKINNNISNLQNYFKIQEMFTDELFAKGSIAAIELHKTYGKSPVYAYVYDNPSPKGVGNVLSERNEINFGCTHGDDVFLILSIPHRDDIPFRQDELIISKKFIEMVHTFTKTGIAVFGEIILPSNQNSTNAKFLKITNNTAIEIEIQKNIFN